MNVGCICPHCTSMLYVYTVTLQLPLVQIILFSCNQMTALAELKGQNETNKQQKHVKGKPPHKQDGGCSC